MPIAWYQSSYPAVITIKTGESAKEKTKCGQTGSTTKTSIKSSLFKQQTLVLSNAKAVTRTYPNSWFINLNMRGQEIRSDQNMANLFYVSQWIRLAWGAAMNRVLRGVRYWPVRSINREAVGRNESERKFSLEIELIGAVFPFAQRGRRNSVCGLASIVECFRGLNRRHAAKGFHLNKGESSFSRGACRIK